MVVWGTKAARPYRVLVEVADTRTAKRAERSKKETARTHKVKGATC